MNHYGLKYSTIHIRHPERSKADVNATILGNFGLGSGFVLGKSRTDQVTSPGDLAPLFSLRWNHKTSNFMAYVAQSIPVGAVGYAYQQLSCDSGMGNFVGRFKCRSFK